MMSVDTNIVLRFILGDAPEQSQTAEAIFRGPTFIALTVLIEAGWVLAYSYGRSRLQIADALLALIDQPNVALDSEPAVRQSPP